MTAERRLVPSAMGNCSKETVIGAPTVSLFRRVAAFFDAKSTPLPGGKLSFSLLWESASCLQLGIPLSLSHSSPVCRRKLEQVRTRVSPRGPRPQPRGRYRAFREPILGWAVKDFAWDQISGTRRRDFRELRLYLDARFPLRRLETLVLNSSSQVQAPGTSVFFFPAAPLWAVCGCGGGGVRLLYGQCATPRRETRRRRRKRKL